MSPVANSGETQDGDAQQRGLNDIAEKLSGGYRSVGSMVYDILRDAILEGVLAPGERLRQETLATSIGVSRVPVRSALIQLEADGLVQFHERRGAVVKTLSAEQVREIYDIRAVLESYALRTSMAEMTPERLERLRDLAARADEESEGSTFVEARNAFYHELYAAESNPMLVQLIDELRVKVGRYLLGWRLVSGHTHSHTAMADVVAAGDVDAAEAELVGHLSTVRDGVLSMLTDSESA